MGKIFEILEENKSKIITGFVFAVIGIILFVGIYFFNTINTNADSVDSDIVEEKEVEATNKISKTTSKIKVDIKGQIKNPGVYEASSSDRVIDIIKKSGGLEKNADTDTVNLSKVIYDEMVIIIPIKKDAKEANTPKVVLKNDAGVNDIKQSTSNEKSINSGIVNINTASLKELITLTGIGESKANAIIEYRTKNGKFKTIDDIKKVSGIGSSLFEKIKNNITT